MDEWRIPNPFAAGSNPAIRAVKLKVLKGIQKNVAKADEKVYAKVYWRWKVSIVWAQPKKRELPERVDRLEVKSILLT